MGPCIRPGLRADRNGTGNIGPDQRRWQGCGYVFRRAEDFGFGGTTQRADAAPVGVGERVVKIQFDANTNPDLPWKFRPKQREVAVRVGEEGLAFYRAENLSADIVMGQAGFNVTPLKAGKYFNKVQCFCFNEQVLLPGQAVDMPVTFFVDPAIVDDPDLDDVDTITLSYTFFRQEMTDEEKKKYRLSQAPLPREAGNNGFN